MNTFLLDLYDVLMEFQDLSEESYDRHHKDLGVSRQLNFLYDELFRLISHYIRDDGDGSESYPNPYSLSSRLEIFMFVDLLFHRELLQSVEDLMPRMFALSSIFPHLSQLEIQLLYEAANSQRVFLENPFRVTEIANNNTNPRHSSSEELSREKNKQSIYDEFGFDALKPYVFEDLRQVLSDNLLRFIQLIVSHQEPRLAAFVSSTMHQWSLAMNPVTNTSPSDAHQVSLHTRAQSRDRNTFSLSSAVFKDIFHHLNMFVRVATVLLAKSAYIRDNAALLVKVPVDRSEYASPASEAPSLSLKRTKSEERMVDSIVAIESVEGAIAVPVISSIDHFSDERNGCMLGKTSFSNVMGDEMSDETSDKRRDSFGDIGMRKTTNTGNTMNNTAAVTNVTPPEMEKNAQVEEIGKPDLLVLPLTRPLPAKLVSASASSKQDSLMRDYMQSSVRSPLDFERNEKDKNEKTRKGRTDKDEKYESSRLRSDLYADSYVSTSQLNLSLFEDGGVVIPHSTLITSPIEKKWKDEKERGNDSMTDGTEPAAYDNTVTFPPLLRATLRQPQRESWIRAEVGKLNEGIEAARSEARGIRWNRQVRQSKQVLTGTVVPISTRTTKGSGGTTTSSSVIISTLDGELQESLDRWDELTAPVVAFPIPASLRIFGLGGDPQALEQSHLPHSCEYDGAVGICEDIHGNVDGNDNENVKENVNEYVKEYVNGDKSTDKDMKNTLREKKHKRFSSSSSTLTLLDTPSQAKTIPSPFVGDPLGSPFTEASLEHELLIANTAKKIRMAWKLRQKIDPRKSMSKEKYTMTLSPSELDFRTRISAGALRSADPLEAGVWDSIRGTKGSGGLDELSGPVLSLRNAVLRSVEAQLASQVGTLKDDQKEKEGEKDMDRMVEMESERGEKGEKGERGENTDSLDRRGKDKTKEPKQGKESKDSKDNGKGKKVLPGTLGIGGTGVIDPVLLTQAISARYRADILHAPRDDEDKNRETEENDTKSNASIPAGSALRHNGEKSSTYPFFEDSFPFPVPLRPSKPPVFPISATSSMSSHRNICSLFPSLPGEIARNVYAYFSALHTGSSSVGANDSNGSGKSSILRGPSLKTFQKSVLMNASPLPLPSQALPTILIDLDSILFKDLSLYSILHRAAVSLAMAMFHTSSESNHSPHDHDHNQQREQDREQERKDDKEVKRDDTMTMKDEVTGENKSAGNISKALQSLPKPTFLSYLSLLSPSSAALSEVNDVALGFASSSIASSAKVGCDKSEEKEVNTRAEDDVDDDIEAVMNAFPDFPMWKSSYSGGNDPLWTESVQSILVDPFHESSTSATSTGDLRNPWTFLAPPSLFALERVVTEDLPRDISRNPTFNDEEDLSLYHGFGISMSTNSPVAMATKGGPAPSQVASRADIFLRRFDSFRQLYCTLQTNAITTPNESSTATPKVVLENDDILQPEDSVLKVTLSTLLSNYRASSSSSEDEPTDSASPVDSVFYDILSQSLSLPSSAKAACLAVQHLIRSVPLIQRLSTLLRTFSSLGISVGLTSCDHISVLAAKSLLVGAFLWVPTRGLLSSYSGAGPHAPPRVSGVMSSVSTLTSTGLFSPSTADAMWKHLLDDAKRTLWATCDPLSVGRLYVVSKIDRTVALRSYFSDTIFITTLPMTSDEDGLTRLSKAFQANAKSISLAAFEALVATAKTKANSKGYDKTDILRTNVSTISIDMKRRENVLSLWKNSTGTLSHTVLLGAFQTGPLHIHLDVENAANATNSAKTCLNPWLELFGDSKGVPPHSAFASAFDTSTVFTRVEAEGKPNSTRLSSKIPPSVSSDVWEKDEPEAPIRRLISAYISKHIRKTLFGLSTTTTSQFQDTSLGLGTAMESFEEDMMASSGSEPISPMNLPATHSFSPVSLLAVEDPALILQSLYGMLQVVHPYTVPIPE